MKRIITLTSLVLTGWLTVTSQNSADALRYSMTEVLGSGRSIALGGAMGALGADFSVIGVLEGKKRFAGGTGKPPAGCAGRVNGTVV